MSGIPLTPFEENVLAVLRSNAGNVVSREELHKALYPFSESQPPKSNVLEVVVGRLRRKGHTNIQTARNRGYMIEAPISIPDPPQVNS